MKKTIPNLIKILCLAIAMVRPVFGQDPHQQPETRMSETNSGGKYKRVKETSVSGQVVSLITESGTQGSGINDLVVTKLFDAGKMTFCSISDSKDHTNIRSYFVNEKLSLQEGDEDGDGFYETLIIFDSKEKPVLAFHRKPDGTVTTFSSQEIGKVKAGFSLLDGNSKPVKRSKRN